MEEALVPAFAYDPFAHCIAVAVDNDTVKQTQRVGPDGMQLQSVVPGMSVFYRDVDTTRAASKGYEGHDAGYGRPQQILSHDNVD